MNTTIEALGRRLEILTDGVHFFSDFDRAPDSPEQLLAIGKHNTQQWAKVEAMAEERQERIKNLIANMLASIFQKETIDKYGNTDTIAVRKVLENTFNQPDNQEFWGRVRQTAEQVLRDSGLTEEQCQAVMRDIIDQLPQVIMEVIEELTSPLTFMPRAEAQSVALALTDLMKEVKA